jgi:cytochrome b6-f complex iron-sulfur subunit
VNRRQFIQAGTLAGCAGASLSGCIGFHYVNTSLSGNRLVVRKEDFGSARFALVDAPGLALPLYLYRLEDGSFSAVSTRCMHRGCQVEPAAEHLVCPCHGSEYSNVGEVLKGPTERPLRRLPVAVEGDRILIELPPDPDRW